MTIWGCRPGWWRSSFHVVGIVSRNDLGRVGPSRAFSWSRLPITTAIRAYRAPSAPYNFCNVLEKDEAMSCATARVIYQQRSRLQAKFHPPTKHPRNRGVCKEDCIPRAPVSQMRGDDPVRDEKCQESQEAQGINDDLDRNWQFFPE